MGTHLHVPPIDDRHAAPAWLVATGAIGWRVVAAVAGLWALVLAVRTLQVIVVPVLLAFLLAAVVEPVVRRAPDRWPSWLAPLALVLLIGAAVLGGIAGLGVRIADELPELRDEYRAGVGDLEDRFGVELPDLPGGDESSSDRSPTGRSAQGGDGGATTGTATEVVRLGVEILFGLFLTLALAFLFLKDGRAMWAWALDKVRGGSRAEVDRAGRAAWSTLGSYVRGLTVVAAFDAAGVALGLLVLGVPLVATLAALQFVASYVPTIGAFVAGGVAVLVAYASGGLTTAALTVALVVVVQQIGNDVIEPWIMGRTMPLHPAVVLIAVTVGAIVWGIPGALLFVPLAAAVSAVGHVVWDGRRDVAGGDAA